MYVRLLWRIVIVYDVIGAPFVAGEFHIITTLEPLLTVVGAPGVDGGLAAST